VADHIEPADAEDIGDAEDVAGQLVHREGGDIVDARAG
jgi:hypothetical protein